MTEFASGATVRVRTGRRGRPPLGTVRRVYANGDVKVLTNSGEVFRLPVTSVTLV